MRQDLDTGRRHGYANALAGLWGGLTRTLAALETIAAHPETLDETALAVLPSLQYSLHRASEQAFGFAPPAGSETAHAELGAALVDARDLTGELIEALELGGPASALPLVPEWRGTLFRVRLARHRLGSRPLAPQPVHEQPAGFAWSALVAALLVTAGAFAFTAGAILVTWPLWVAGLSLVAGGFFFYRP